VSDIVLNDVKELTEAIFNPPTSPFIKGGSEGDFVPFIKEE